MSNLEEAQDGTIYELVKGVKDSPTFLVDEYYQIFNLVHDFSSSTLPTTTIAHEDDNWVKRFLIFVSTKEEEPHTVIQWDLMRGPSHSKNK